MLLFTKHQVESAQQARDLQAGLGCSLVTNLKWIVEANMLKDFPVVVQDVDVALKVWGKHVCAYVERQNSSPQERCG